MDATCILCGNPADVATIEGAEALCAACAKRAKRRSLIFDVSTTAAPRESTPTPTPTPTLEVAFDDREEPSSQQQETRMLDLRDLARLTRESLAALPRAEEPEAQLSVHEALRLVDSLAPTALVPAPVDLGSASEAANESESESKSASEAPRLAATTPSRPARRRLRAAYGGFTLLIGVGALLAVKARSERETSSAAIAPEPTEQAEPMTQSELAAPLSATPTPSVKDVASVAPAQGTSAKATSATTTTPAVAAKRVPVAPPPSPSLPPARPRTPAPAAVEENRATAEPDATPHVDLLGAMQAAVEKRSSTPGAVKGGCVPTPGAAPGAPSPCARATPRTSPLRP
jgi:hypothetical protein